jgi:hypothetical protein
MKRLPSGRPLRYAGGTAAVELAVLLPILMLLLAAPLFFGRIFWHYTAAQKAAHDAVRFLSTASAAEMRTPGAGGTEAPIAAAAREIVRMELAELNPGPDQPFIDVQCNGIGCAGFTIPTKVTVSVRMPMYDEFFGAFTAQFTGGDQILLQAAVTMDYVGN